MGIINPNAYETIYGNVLYNTYISLGKDVVLVRKVEQDGVYKYEVVSNYYVYVDKNARDTGKANVGLEGIVVHVTSEELNTNIYSIIYNKIKEKYPNSIDVE